MTNKFHGYVLLKDPQLDCPNRDCDGWLNLYGLAKDGKPAYFQCSNKHHPDPNFRCDHATIFSKRVGTCTACGRSIAMRDIITTSWDRTWVHLRCAHGHIQPADVFAVCLRCRGNITNVTDSEPSTSGGVSGYIHVRCAKKRPRETFDETDTEPTSSQETGV